MQSLRSLKWEYANGDLTMAALRLVVRWDGRESLVRDAVSASPDTASLPEDTVIRNCKSGFARFAVARILVLDP